MKRIYRVLLDVAVVAGCARTWQFQALEAYRTAESIPAAAACQGVTQASTGPGEGMAIVPVVELHECGACHSGLAAHGADPATVPARITSLAKTK